MTESSATGDTAGPGLGLSDVAGAGAADARLDLLTRARRALAGRPAADDAALLDLLGPIICPVLGDLAALYAREASDAEVRGGACRLAGVVSAAGDLAARLRCHVAVSPQSVTEYTAAISARQPASVRPSPVQALGIMAEMVVPLGRGGEPDALLAIGSTDADRRYAAADLATAEVLAALFEAARAAREAEQREAKAAQLLEESGRIGRMFAHQLNNDLTMPVGAVELLLDRGDIEVELREMVEAASRDLAAVEEHIREFHTAMRAISGGLAAPRPTDAEPRFR